MDNNFKLCHFQESEEKPHVSRSNLYSLFTLAT